MRGHYIDFVLKRLTLPISVDGEPKITTKFYVIKGSKESIGRLAVHSIDSEELIKYIGELIDTLSSVALSGVNIESGVLELEQKMLKAKAKVQALTALKTT